MLRFTLPHADPYLFPLVAVLACFGLVMLYRLDEDFAREQAQWFVVGLIFFSATIVALQRDHRVLERYRYSIALAGILLLLLPRLGSPINGAYLSFEDRPDRLPAGRAGEDRDRHLPRLLPDATRARCSSSARGASWASRSRR